VIDPERYISTMNIEAAREQMIGQQVNTWEVFDDRVLTVMREVRREQFVPPAWQGVAFADSTIPLPHGQTMLPPNFHGRILQALQLTPTDLALEVGTGSGYLSACMGHWRVGYVRSKSFLSWSKWHALSFWLQP